MDLVKLPHDVFVVIISYLSPRTCVRCRAVSRRWRAAFADTIISLLLLRWHFPRCRELRLSAAASALLHLHTSSDTSASSTSGTSGTSDASDVGAVALPSNFRAELLTEAATQRDWAATLAEVARRYWHLRRARPWKVEKIAIAMEQDPYELEEEERYKGFTFDGVRTWQRYLELNDKRTEFDFPDPKWSYSQEDGVLVYPADLPDIAAAGGRIYHVLDLATGQRVPVPFDVRRRIVRRVRLVQGVLAIEWAESVAHTIRADTKHLHRHFSTVFDVVRVFRAKKTCEEGQDEGEGRSPGWDWTVSFRSEWKLAEGMTIGLTVTSIDRFFTTHTATHYAAYFWLTRYNNGFTRAPFEQLLVWDISTPAPNPPRLIRRLLPRELLWYRLLQHRRPRFRALALDETNLYVLEEDHRWVKGLHGSHFPPRVHLVRCTGIPVVAPPVSTPGDGTGENEEMTEPESLVLDDDDDDDNDDDDDDDDDDDETELELISPTANGSALGTPAPPVFGPHWVDECGANGDVNMNFCQRVGIMNNISSGHVNHSHSHSHANGDGNGNGNHSNGEGSSSSSSSTAPQFAQTPSSQGPDSPPAWPWALSNGQDVTASTAGITITDRILHPYFHPQAAGMMRTKGHGQDPLATALLLPPRQRWPGWAPCWRHEDFPYLTVSEMLDFAAGVRIAARRCFMLETLSVHVRPALWVKGGAAAVEEDDDDDDDDDDRVGGSSSSSRSGSGSGSGSGYGSMDRGNNSSGHYGSTNDNNNNNNNNSNSNGKTLARQGGTKGSKKTGGGGGATAETAAAAAAATREVQFPDELWSELLGKGHIAGDERWLVGEEMQAERQMCGFGLLVPRGVRETINIVRF